jgi:hypothetical protein
VLSAIATPGRPKEKGRRPRRPSFQCQRPSCYAVRADIASYRSYITASTRLTTYATPGTKHPITHRMAVSAAVIAKIKKTPPRGAVFRLTEQTMARFTGKSAQGI